MKLKKTNLRIPIKKFARPTASSSVDDALTDEAAVNEMINVLRRRKELRKRSEESAKGFMKLSKGHGRKVHVGGETYKQGVYSFLQNFTFLPIAHGIINISEKTIAASTS